MDHDNKRYMSTLDSELARMIALQSELTRMQGRLDSWFEEEHRQREGTYRFPCMNGTPFNSAVKRSSMDLSRVLSKFRYSSQDPRGKIIL